MARRIQNFEALATSELRLDALSIVEAGYAALDVGDALTRTLRIEGDTLRVNEKTSPLSKRRVFFIGIGKCAFTAAEAIEKLFGDRLTGGIALDVSSTGQSLTKIEAYVGTHPLPSEANEAATARIMTLLADCTEHDLVIMLISGGGSTLLCSHEAPMTCTDESLLWNELTKRGATIQDMNTVRKHMSRARGGGLAVAAYPAEVLSLIVSDVPGNDITVVASGPTILDTSTVADARAVLARYGLASSTALELRETPKEQKYFDRVTALLLLTNQDALAAMQKEAAKRGYTPQIVNDRFSGEASALGTEIAEKLHHTPAKTALLYAGESTVTGIDAHGRGGRNQEMALAALQYLNPGELLLPFASDGRDNTEYAGAIGDATTRAHAHEGNLSPEEYLREHRTYDFFRATGDALLTGYTGSNVSDLIIALKK